MRSSNSSGSNRRRSDKMTKVVMLALQAEPQRPVQVGFLIRRNRLPICRRCVRCLLSLMRCVRLKRPYGVDRQSSWPCFNNDKRLKNVERRKNINNVRWRSNMQPRFSVKQTMYVTRPFCAHSYLQG
uniref:Uncharacterized protein n=1 Tax=Lygus hesperus TaxID=30085 RepID=A0A146L375_LYGHE